LLKTCLKWLAFSCIWLIWVPSAQADFRVCNKTQNPVEVAIGYRNDSGWVSEGWWVIEGRRCESLLKGALLSRFYYFYAEDLTAKGQWSGSVTMCGKEEKFKIEGVHDCFARGYRRFGFQEVDTGNQMSWMVQLEEPEMTNSTLTPPATTGAATP